MSDSNVFPLSADEVRITREGAAATSSRRFRAGAGEKRERKEAE
jgi:hypothetical protein